MHIVLGLSSRLVIGLKGFLLMHDLIHDGGLARVVEAHDQDLARLRAHAQRAEEALEEAHCGQHATPRMTRIPTTAAGRPRAARQSPRAPELHYYSRDTRSIGHRYG